MLAYDIATHYVIKKNLTYIDGPLCPIRILNGGIISLNPLIVHELGCLQTTRHQRLFKRFRGCLLQNVGERIDKHIPVKQLLPTPPLVSKHQSQQMLHVMGGLGRRRVSHFCGSYESERTHLHPARPH